MQLCSYQGEHPCFKGHMIKGIIYSWSFHIIFIIIIIIVVVVVVIFLLQLFLIKMILIRLPVYDCASPCSLPIFT